MIDEHQRKVSLAYRALQKALQDLDNLGEDLKPLTGGRPYIQGKTKTTARYADGKWSTSKNN